MKEQAEVNVLYAKYVSKRTPVNLLELFGCVRRETKLAEQGVISVTRNLLRELRADRNRVSYLAHKAIGREELKNPFAPFASYTEWMLNRYIHSR